MTTMPFHTLAPAQDKMWCFNNMETQMSYKITEKQTHQGADNIIRVHSALQDSK